MRILILLFCVTTFTIFGLSEEDLEMSTTATTTLSRLQVQPMLKTTQQEQPPQQQQHLLHAVKTPNYHQYHLTYKQKEEAVERFYHQPALVLQSSSRGVLSKCYYAVVLLGVVLWAVRYNHKSSSHRRRWRHPYHYYHHYPLTTTTTTGRPTASTSRRL
jgi:hypothetical protein